MDSTPYNHLESVCLSHSDSDQSSVHQIRAGLAGSVVHVYIALTRMSGYILTWTTSLPLKLISDLLFTFVYSWFYSLNLGISFTASIFLFTPVNHTEWSLLVDGPCMGTPLAEEGRYQRKFQIAANHGLLFLLSYWIYIHSNFYLK